VVITELGAASPLVLGAGSAAALPLLQAGIDEEEAGWTAVVDSVHHRRKARGKAKIHGDAVWKSQRLAGKEPAMHLDMTKKAVDFHALKETLKGCSIKLQVHVSKSKVLQRLASPMGMKSVSELRDAAFGRDAAVTTGSDD
jgi:hypothetical protein